MSTVVFISQPMSGLPVEVIESTRNGIINSIKYNSNDPNQFFFIDNLQKDKDPETTSALEYLGEDIKLLDKADVVYFATGWEKSRGCNIEFQVAKEYGKRMVFEEDFL